MKNYIIFGVGSVSDLNVFNEKYKTLDNKKIFDYLESKNINTIDPIKMSCHRTLDRVIKYADQIEKLSNKNNIIVVLFGGLSFALPGIFSSQTKTVPIIAVPKHINIHGGGLDSTTAVYNLPPGISVGGVPISGLDKAILISEKLLNFDYNNQKIIVSNFYNKKDLLYNDERNYLSLQYKNALEKEDNNEFINTISILQLTSQTLYFSNERNANMFLEKIYSMHMPNMKEKLINDYYKNISEIENKYGPIINLEELNK